MAVFHDEVEIEEFQHDEDSEMYFCPCLYGDDFSITKSSFMCGETVTDPSTNKELVNC
ncbi:diphthamide biosynthesis protein 3-like [Vicugna pacos]|uniref:Diphthamide biosynthesis protein 3-like n=1 Tax=Vicugna pacos TaxID=30538 RepID=A0ABM5E8V8_VICPA